jgi:hypothetical protein
MVLKFLFLEGFGYKAAHRELCWVLSKRNYLLSQTDNGFVGSRTVIFHVKMKIGHTLRMEFNGTWRSCL